jgi:hypothetical protein
MIMNWGSFTAPRINYTCASSHLNSINIVNTRLASVPVCVPDDEMIVAATGRAVRIAGHVTTRALAN